jgi:hypothetical protein
VIFHFLAPSKTSESSASLQWVLRPQRPTALFCWPRRVDAVRSFPPPADPKREYQQQVGVVTAQFNLVAFFLIDLLRCIGRLTLLYSAVPFRMHLAWSLRTLSLSFWRTSWRARRSRVARPAQSFGRIAFEIVVQRSSFPMAARAKRRQSPVAAAAAPPRTTATESKHAATTNVQTAAVAAEATGDDQLPPLFLQAVVICCTGFWLVIALRDFATTGKSIFGTYDDAYLVRAPIRHYFCSIDDPSIIFAMPCSWLCIV